MTPEDIRRAIVAHRQIVATYRGHLREFCPHVLGTFKGEWRVLGWQFGGGSGAGLKPGGEWRCFVVGELEDGALRKGIWHRGASMGWDQVCVDDIDTEVDSAFSARTKKR
jgi:hypothetical protein